MMKRILLAALLLLLLCVSAHADVKITEVMASTATFVGERHDDWVELHNTGSKSVSLKGWYLSDDPYNLKKWAFPDTAKIANNSYLVVYCAGETVTNGVSGCLYATFKISASGDSVYLTNPDGETVSVTFGKQFGNVSSGYPEGSDEWQYLEDATPGKKNPSSGYSGRADAPVITTEAGFYDQKLSVSITCEEGLEIRYTLDGSTPTRSSSLYSKPISITKTTVVRARAFSKSCAGSETVGSTFFVNDPASVPVVSIYTDNTYLYNQKTGVMVKGSGSVANYDKDWEYPIQVEYFDASGVRQIAQMATFRVTSHSSRTLKQKSIALFARSAFGSDTFDYAFFDNRDYTSYSAILLRSTNSDHKSCRMRDAVFGEMSEGLGLYYQAAQPIIVYLNGEYFGHYNLREKDNKDSLAQWEGITDKDIIDNADILCRTGTSDSHVLHGSNEDWVALIDFVKTHDLNVPENLQHLEAELDIDSYLNFAIFNMMIGNYDTSNTRMYRFPGGKWTFFLHDIEAGCMSYDESPVDIFIRDIKAKASNFPHWILSALLNVPEYKDYFLRRVAEIVQSNFLYSIQVEPIWNKYIDTIGALLPRHIKKFPGLTIKNWKANISAAQNYSRLRPKKVIGYICSRLGLSSAEEEAYFAETYALLKQYNTK